MGDKKIITESKNWIIRLDDFCYSFAHRPNAQNFRRFSDALALISKVFDLYEVLFKFLITITAVNFL